MNRSTILVADDDAAIRTVVVQALTRAGYDVRAAGNVATLWQWIEKGEGDLVITDVIMPDENGLDLVPRIRRLRPDLRIVVMSAQTTLMTAVKATEKGAFDYLPKPFDINDLISIVKRGIESEKDIGARLNEDVFEETLPLIGRSPAMQEVYRTVARLMPTDLTVMINGESGTGKELFARALHDYGKRKSAPFVAVNMAAIPRELIESELFGHEKGAFTGAVARSTGRFEQAEGGTLFLDEIGDMPLGLHMHSLVGLPQRTYLEAVKHGVDNLYCCVWPVADGNAPPAVQTTVRNLRYAGYEVTVNDQAVDEISRHFEEQAFLHDKPIGEVQDFDLAHFDHQIPGGVLSNLGSQLREVGLEHKLPHVLEECGRVREDLGWPIQVTPFAQFLAVQGTFNAIHGDRYSVVPDEIKKYALGYFGKHLCKLFLN